MRKFKFTRISVVLLLTLPLALGAAVLWGLKLAHDSYPQLEPGLKPEFVGSLRCIECHEELGERWAASYHAKSMDVARTISVVGVFV